MEDLDLTIRHGTVVTAVDTFQCDIGISDGRIVTLSEHLPAGGRDINASGRLVLPGGVDSHCHVEQLSSMGVMCADDFYSATVSAAFGGTTTIIPFAAQHRGQTIKQTVDDYAECARSKAVIDYGFHLIVSDPTEDVLRRELPEYIRGGLTSFKVFTTYDRLRLDDSQVLEVLAVADQQGALVMVHAENHEMIRWIGTRLVDRGHTEPKYHATSHDPLAESEAIYRVIQLARLLDAPLMIVHVSTSEAVHTIQAAQTLGRRIYAETCPQYLFLTATDIDRPGLEGAKFCCSPPPRDPDAQEALWRGLARGAIQLYSSDHAPYRFDASGKLPKGEHTTFKDMANGVPGLEVRLPLLFSEGVLRNRITLNQFVALTATNHAKMYGLHPRKGTLAVGSDGDVTIWDPEKEVTICTATLHDNVGYTPYEGRVVRGWPETVISRGRTVVAGGTLQVEGGSGVFLPRGTPGPVAQCRRPSPGTDYLRSLIA